MNCLIHADINATRFCNNCGAPICNECVRSIDNRTLCPDCFKNELNKKINAVNKKLKFDLAYLIFAAVCILVPLIICLSVSHLDQAVIMYLCILCGLPNTLLFGKFKGRNAAEGFFMVIGIIWATVAGFVVTPIMAIIRLVQFILLIKEKKQIQACLNNINVKRYPV